MAKRHKMRISKDLVAASATPLILLILKESESYGYAIIKEVHRLSEARIHWTDGMLYPVLHRLERQGLISSYWQRGATGRRRKYYRINSNGLKELDCQREQWRLIHSTLGQLWDLFSTSSSFTLGLI